MKAGYKVKNNFEKVARFILVSNLPFTNTVLNYSCKNEVELKYSKDGYDIGFWRIKRK